jgi:hypothetical protein
MSDIEIMKHNNQKPPSLGFACRQAGEMEGAID